MKTRAHIFVKGHVQGVFFRIETYNRAQRQNVTGWVKNLRDGRIEVVFEGEMADVETMVEYCRRGPPDAIVINTEVFWEESTGEFKDFRIRY